MTIDEFKVCCDLTIELVRLRQNECKHLCIENIAPDLLFKIMLAKKNLDDGLVTYLNLDFGEPK